MKWLKDIWTGLTGGDQRDEQPPAPPSLMMRLETAVFARYENPADAVAAIKPLHAEWLEEIGGDTCTSQRMILDQWATAAVRDASAGGGHLSHAGTWTWWPDPDPPPLPPEELARRQRLREADERRQERARSMTPDELDALEQLRQKNRRRVHDLYYDPTDR